MLLTCINETNAVSIISNSPFLCDIYLCVCQHLLIYSLVWRSGLFIYVLEVSTVLPFKSENMARLVKTLRNNWKKTVVGTAALLYGGKYAADSYERRQLMRSYCKTAKEYGEVSIPVDLRPRHITVILNPAANRRKAKKDFEEYCAPLLYLAGISLNVVLTEGEGQARSLAEKLEEVTDAIIIAGGDGTLSEVITGLMRRKDNVTITRKVPIGVLPLGRTNTVAHNLFVDSCNEPVKFLAEATMAIIREVTQPLDVIKFQVLQTKNNNNTEIKPVFGVAGLEWGAFRDARAARDKYWYFGSLRGYASYIFTGLKDDKSGVGWHSKAKLQFSPPCLGCSKCYSDRLDLQPKIILRQSWWSVFGKRNAVNGPAVPNIDYSSIQNEECGKSQDLMISTADLSVSPCTPNEIICRSQAPFLRISYGLSDLSAINFIKEGWQRERGNNPTRPVAIKSREVVIWPLHPSPVIMEDGSGSPQAMAAECWMSIDSEDYEEKAVKATLLPNILTIFSSSPQQF